MLHLTHLTRLTSIILCLMIGSHIHADNTPTIPFPSAKDPAALLTNEISRLDTLIQATQQSLDGQKKLRESIVAYKDLQEKFLKNTDDNELLLAVVKSAHRTLRLIKENNLTQTFDPEFIEELTVLAQAAGKRGIPKP